MYQRINTFYNNDTKDTCFILEETVQICTNYRTSDALIILVV